MPLKNYAPVSKKLKNADSEKWMMQRMLSSACLPSEGRCLHFTLRHRNLLEWISKAVGKALLLLVKQKRPMCRAFTASISQGISNESECLKVKYGYGSQMQAKFNNHILIFFPCNFISVNISVFLISSLLKRDLTSSLSEGNL